MTKRIHRWSTTLSSVVVDTTNTSSTEVDFSEYAGGVVYVPNVTGAIGNITFEVSDKKGGTYHALEDSGGTAVSITAEINKGYPLPDELFGANHFRMVAATNAKTCIVTLKG
mgnify:CR=1 FL=1